MKKTLVKFWSQHTALALGACISFALLIMFLLFQYNLAAVLKLESRWLIVSGVPLLAALLVGGYIRSFKGFGVELEASLGKPVANLELSATEAMEQMQGERKGSIPHLKRISEGERRKISRLVLTQGRPRYYGPQALRQYLRELSGLKYIEIRNQSGKFVALIPISEFKRNNNIDNRLIDEFIHTLEQSQVLQQYSDSVVTVHISEDTDLIESLKLMRKKRTKKLVVLDDNGIFLGLLLSRSVEKRILDDVLAAKENA